LLSFLGFLSSCLFAGRPSDQKLCHALKGALRGLPELLSGALCGTWSATEAADAALDALNPDRHLSLPALLCLNATEVNGDGILPMIALGIRLARGTGWRQHRGDGQGGLI